MKKITSKARQRDVVRSEKNRGAHRCRVANGKERIFEAKTEILLEQRWVKNQRDSGLQLSFLKKGAVRLDLPATMNFSSDYELTALYLMAIRRLATKAPSRRRLHLGSVNFEGLRDISTSAALVLTAELSKWEDTIRAKLKPQISRWDPFILAKFHDLGFFELFNISVLDGYENKSEYTQESKVVKYIKGHTGDLAKTRFLKDQIRLIVGEEVNKWVFLNTGLSEAITNVTHHAYPIDDNGSFAAKDKTWYLTGSFNASSKELKVVFYDQGIGIPKSLPASDVWERALKYLAKFSLLEQKRDSTMLKAAVELSRTSTGEADRGKGLQDLLEFVKQRGDGYLSIISHRGLYKYTVSGGASTVKSGHFGNPIRGTLIIWQTTLG
jgi:hypothetical protein